jgi:tetratricopeptide (TPR) repeat protein
MTPIRRIILLFAALLAVAGSATAFISWRRDGGINRHPLVEPASAYANTRLAVRYVGDSACTNCHGKIVETFREHPMGRSLSPIATATNTGGDEASGRPLFVSHGLEYSIERRDGRVLHQETRRDPSGRIVARNEVEVQFVLGSGSQGIAYLVERDGFLFQSPISWYVEKRKWDLAPGYEKLNVHFDRPVASTCLYCHANRVEPVAGTINRYQPPIFQGHAIGCERCHGPGELHVRRPSIVDGRDTTIVNPAGLEPSLRDAVCEQCHLLGHRRVVKLDRREEDYRPGLPFDQFWSVFEPAAGKAEDRFVGQVEQMHESRCFRASRGGLGCISCHDPHQRPRPESKAQYYRERCLECHADRGCNLPSALRLARSQTDDCISCHMPDANRTDIIHAVATDHRILRKPDGEDPSSIAAVRPRAGERPLVLFHRERMDDRQRNGAERDLGVALCRDGPVGAAIALPLLEAALAVRPDDLVADEAKGFALDQLGRSADGLTTFRSALDREPARESALIGAMGAAARAGRQEEAIADLRRAIVINPMRSAYHANLASLYFQGRDWPAAAAACRQTLRLNPADLTTRKLFVRCYLRMGDRQAARGELDTLLGFDSPDREELIRWFAPVLPPR